MALDTTPAARHRLVTRTDFDGLVCAVLLKELDLLDDIMFVHPKDMQDGKIEVSRARHHDQPALRARRRTSRSTTTPREAIRVEDSPDEPHHRSRARRRAARVVYDYYGGAERFPTISDEMMAAVDKADAAQFSATRSSIPRAGSS